MGVGTRGYQEEGTTTTTTPFDMVMLNSLDRFHLVMDVIDRVPFLGSRADVANAQEHRSGLLALAGTADMRDVEARAAAGDEAATLAFDVLSTASSRGSGR